jgi:hypothetical protein
MWAALSEDRADGASLDAPELVFAGEAPGTPCDIPHRRRTI